MDTMHLAVMMNSVVAEHGSRIATRIKDGDSWRTCTYAEFGTDFRRLAACLIERGVNPGDRVAIFSVNRPEWSIADFACLSVRAISVPLYPTSTPEQVLHILRDSGSVMALVAGESEVNRIIEVWAELPKLRSVITFDDVDIGHPRVTSLQELLTGSEADETQVDARLAEAKAEDLASLIYTSGTTGAPKGVMLTNRGFTFQIDSLNKFFHITPEDTSLCFLPLSHALERAWTYVVLSHGCMNTYVPDARQVAQLLSEVKPTMLTSVPRLYEKVFQAAREKVASSKAKRLIFDWAMRVGRHCHHAYRKGQVPAVWWRIQLPLADKLILKNIRNAMGGPKKVLACGGAPLRKEIEEFFLSADMLLLQGYGLTEASPLCNFNAPDAFKFGTCGRVIVGGEIQISEDGEILYRGPNAMAGYWNQPEATAATIRDGWLHTGDVGQVDNEGFLIITDRIKDLIITSTGKNVAPGSIESLVLADPLFEYAVLLGDNRPFLTLLVFPSLPQLESLAKHMQIKWRRHEELFDHPENIAEIKRRVKVLTSKLPPHEQIKDLRVLIGEITQHSGLLTPTLKVKRKEVEKRFAELIEDMYSKLSKKRKGRSASE